MLFKGPFGFGKTLAAASFALQGPVYMSYWDKKQPVELITFFTKKRFGSLAEQILDNITFDVYDASNPNDYLNKVISFVSDCRYSAIINDSLTFMTSSCVNWSLNFDQKQRLVKKLKDILPDWDEYKVETSIITQCLDLSKKLPCHVIWTAHPLPSTKVEGSAGSMRVTKINSLVTYGSKVAGLVPGGFTEIYHFAQTSNWDAGGGSSGKRYICQLDAVGDEFAKSPLLGHYTKQLDFTDRLFYQVWKENIDKAFEALRDEPTSSDTDTDKVANPFATNQPQTSKWKV